MNVVVAAAVVVVAVAEAAVAVDVVAEAAVAVDVVDEHRLTGCAWLGSSERSLARSHIKMCIHS